MVMNGVSFNDDLCAAMSKGDFIKLHEESFFLDKSVKDRRKILSDAYDVMFSGKIINEGSPESLKL